MMLFLCIVLQFGVITLTWLTQVRKLGREGGRIPEKGTTMTSPPPRPPRQYKYCPYQVENMTTYQTNP